jgi:hypothetical protein
MYDSSDRRTLQKILQQSEENYAVLKKLQRAERMRTIFRVLYWLIVVLIALGSYYVIQPYINSVKDLTGSIPGVSSFFNGEDDSESEVH